MRILLLSSIFEPIMLISVNSSMYLILFPRFTNTYIFYMTISIGFLELKPFMSFSCGFFWRSWLELSIILVRCLFDCVGALFWCIDCECNGFNEFDELFFGFFLF